MVNYWFVFFKISVYMAIAMFLFLGLVTISDVFIHINQTRFYVITIITSILFFLIALLGLTIYKSFKNIYHFIITEKQMDLVLYSMRKLLFLFGIMAIAIGSIAALLCVALIQRMASGMTLFG